MIIDLTDFDNRKREIGEQLHAAARDVGFFFVKGHGISQEEIDESLQSGNRFFGLPDTVKEEFKWIPDRFLGEAFWLPQYSEPYCSKQSRD